MTRKKFLSKLGVGAAFALTATCLGGCSKNNDLQPISGLTLEFDLNAPANANLLKDGGYVIKDRVVVARTTDGEYVSATQLCSHEDKYKIILRNDEWFCTDHDARFDLNGNGINKNGSKGLAIYTISRNDDILTVTT